MARAKYNGKKGEKEENICYMNKCHHNRDKKRILWKQGIHKTNKTLE